MLPSRRPAQALLPLNKQDVGTTQFIGEETEARIKHFPGQQGSKPWLTGNMLSSPPARGGSPGRGAGPTLGVFSALRRGAGCQAHEAGRPVLGAGDARQLGRWAGPGRGRGRRRARRRLGEDGSPRPQELSGPARGGEGTPEGGEPRCSSGSPTPFPRRHDDPPERRPRGRRGRAAQGDGERRTAALSCIHRQSGIQGTARACPERTQTHSSSSLSTFVSSLLALAPEAKTRP